MKNLICEILRFSLVDHALKRPLQQQGQRTARIGKQAVVAGEEVLAQGYELAG